MFHLIIVNLLYNIFHDNSLRGYAIVTYGKTDGQTRGMSNGYSCKNLRYEQEKNEHNFIAVTKNSSSVDCNEIRSLREYDANVFFVAAVLRAPPVDKT